MCEAVTWVSSEELGQHAAAFTNAEEYAYRQSRAGYGGEPPSRHPLPLPPQAVVWGTGEHRVGGSGGDSGSGSAIYGGGFSPAYGGGGDDGGHGYEEYDENDVPRAARHPLDRLAQWKSDGAIDYRDPSPMAPSW